MKAILGVLAVLVMFGTAAADISPWMSYQGVLTDASGVPVADSSYSVEFAIFNAEVSGANLWTETQSVTTSGGVFDVYLGSVVPLDTLAWDVPYWLGMRIESEPWLVPRTPLTTVPYAAHAGYADTVLEGDTDWSIDGDDVYHETGKVGIGLATGAGLPLDVLAGSTGAARFRNDAQGFNSAVYARNEFGTAGSFFGGEGADSYPSPHAAVYARGHAGHQALHAVSEEQYAIYAHSNTNQALNVSTGGDVCAQFDGGKVVVNDRIQVDEFYMPPGTGGYVLTSDVWGEGTWQPPAAVSDGDWTIGGSNIYRATGNVGIGTTTPQRPLDVVADSGPCARFRNNATAWNFAVNARNESGTAAVFYAGSGTDYYPPIPAAIFSRAEAGYRGAHFTSQDDYALLLSSDSGDALYATTNSGNAAWFAGGPVVVNDGLETNAFEMSAGAASGHVLTSDASGVGTWQAPATAADGDWTINGSDMYAGVTGNVGVGANAPTAKVHVYTGADEQALRVYHDMGTSGQTASIERGQIPGVGNDILQLQVPTGSGIGFQFIECQRGDNVEFAVDGDGYVDSNSGAEFEDLVTANNGVSVYDYVDVYSNSAPVGEFTTNYAAHQAKVVSAVATGTVISADVYALYGESAATDYNGIGVVGVGGYAGVYGKVEPVGGFQYQGLWGRAQGGIGTNIGVRGSAHDATVNYGIYGSTSGTTGTYYAGFFDGDVNVTGTLYGGAPACRVDHPLDPENKYLVHSCVESDEMMNVYNGNVTLDGRGEATVEMPGWFEAFNRDFRYQLTCIGGFAPVYVAEEIENGRFTIAGGEPGMKVSWQVAGVRNDPMAAASPVLVEVDKPAHEVGKYVHPDAYGKPRTLGTGYLESREVATETTTTERPARAERDRRESD